jgi:thymidylate kinase
MPITYEELRDRLRGVDEISLLELLDISSEDIVERFQDRIENRIEQLESDFEQESDEEYTEGHRD